MASIKNAFPKRKMKLQIDDVASLNELLKTNLSIKNCLHLISNKQNKTIIDDLLKKLDGGLLIENIISEYLPLKISTYCKPLIKTMSFSSSLNLALSFYIKAQENTKEIEKAVLYPFVLLFVSLTALYLFDAYALDSILEMLKSFSSSIGNIDVIRILIRIVVYTFYFGLIFIVAFLLYFSRERNISLFYVLVSTYFRNSLFQTYFCEEFISLFLICLNLGYKTKESLEIIKALHNKPIASFLAFHLEERLLQGDGLKAASQQRYFDEVLAKFINIAIYTNEVERILNEYVTFSKNKIKNKMKKFAMLIQFSSYAMIGAVVVFIYQILFLPMQAIANF